MRKLTIAIIAALIAGIFLTGYVIRQQQQDIGNRDSGGLQQDIGNQDSGSLVVKVIDAATNASISGADVVIKDFPICPPNVDLSDCVGKTLGRKYTDKSGHAIFSLSLLQDNNYAVFVAADGYQPINEYIEMDMKPVRDPVSGTVVVKMLPDSLPIKNDNDVATHGKKDEKVAQWFFDHPEYIVNDSRFSYPLRLTEFIDVKDGASADPFWQRTLHIKMDVRNGQVIEVKIFRVNDNVPTLAIPAASDVIQSEEDALSLAQQDKKLREWLTLHPSAKVSHNGRNQGNSPYWDIGYIDKSDCKTTKISVGNNTYADSTECSHFSIEFDVRNGGVVKYY